MMIFYKISLCSMALKEGIWEGNICCARGGNVGENGYLSRGNKTQRE